MTSPSRHAGRAERRYALERRLAPHVAPEWTEAALLELRMLGVAGRRIGEVLAEVDSHCAESGETAADAFGDPVTYARSLGLPADEPDGRADVRSLAPTAMQVLGLLPAAWAIGAVRAGEPLDLTVGHLTGVAVLLLAFGALLALQDGVLRLAVHRPVVLWLAAMTPMVAVVLALVLLDGVVAALPAVPVLVLGVVMVVAGTAWDVVRHRRGADGADPVEVPFGSPELTTRAGRVMAGLNRWLVPVWLVVILALGWLLA